jgi:hypothetical protein
MCILQGVEIAMLSWQMLVFLNAGSPTQKLSSITISIRLWDLAFRWLVFEGLRSLQSQCACLGVKRAKTHKLFGKEKYATMHNW